MLKLEIDASDLAHQLRVLKVALAARDGYTNSHCDRVVYLASELGKLCSLSEAELNVLRMSAAVHDIGKLGVPDRILLKSGRLLPEEWNVMKSHAVLGQEILTHLDIQDIDQIATVVRHHHEAFNGLGYPDGLKGEAIPVMARIVALADSYDAMATTRPYRCALPHEHIMDILSQEAGEKYDPYLQAKFVRLIEVMVRK